MHDQVKTGPQEMNIYEWLGRLTLEIISQGGFGYKLGSLDGRMNPHTRALKEFLYVP